MTFFLEACVWDMWLYCLLVMCSSSANHQTICICHCLFNRSCLDVLYWSSQVMNLINNVSCEDEARGGAMN